MTQCEARFKYDRVLSIQVKSDTETALYQINRTLKSLATLYMATVQKKSVHRGKLI